MNKNQMTQMMREMVDVIKVRDHIYTMVNGPRTSLISKVEEKELRDFANQLDRHVVDISLSIKRGMLTTQAETAYETARQAATKQASALRALEEEAVAEGATGVESVTTSSQSTKEAQEQPKATAPTSAEKPKKKTTRKKGAVRRVEPE